MKYVVSWKALQGGSAADNEAAAERGLQLFSKWSPAADSTFHQFVERLDGTGGYAVIETDNPLSVLDGPSKFGTLFEFKVDPWSTSWRASRRPAKASSSAAPSPSSAHLNHQRPRRRGLCQDRQVPTGISDEHVELHRTARRWAEARCPASVPRALLEAEASRACRRSGTSSSTWAGRRLAVDFGLPEAAIVVEELGRAVAPGPFLPTVLASVLLTEGGAPDLVGAGGGRRPVGRRARAGRRHGRGVRAAGGRRLGRVHETT